MKNVLVGLAVVVAVAAVAALTVATLGAGPVLIGAVAGGALLGGAMGVGLMAASDIARGEVSDMSDYALTGLKDSFIGAVSGAIFGPGAAVGAAFGRKMAMAGAEGAFTSVMDQLLRGEKINWKTVAMDAGIGMFTLGVLDNKYAKKLGGFIGKIGDKISPISIKSVITKGMDKAAAGYQKALNKLSELGSALGKKMKELGKHVVDIGEALNKDLNNLAKRAKDGFQNIADTLFASQLVPAGGPNIQRMSIPDPPQTTHTKVTPERQRQIDALKNGEYSGRVNKANADDINDVYGPYYDEAKKLHEANPEWYPNPDESTILQGKELKKAREEYEALVRRGELEKGHHVQGLSFGGKNKHTEVTVFQNKVLKWQRDTGRRQKNKTRKKGTKRKK